MALFTDQVAGIQRRRIGDVIVTALSDGFVVIPPEALQGVSVSEQDAIYRSAGRRPPFASAINAYLLQWPNRTMLVDTGSGIMMGPDAGKVATNLEAAGVAPGDIDTIVLSHLHPDHSGGLLDDDRPTFPHSDLMVADPEFAFWIDDGNRSSSPDSTTDAFMATRRIAESYEGRIHRFAGSDTIAGIEVVPLPGHTPGHTGYVVESAGDTLLLWGDIFHAPEVQCARPEVSTIFDNDPQEAIRVRRSMLERAVEEDLLIAGGHMSFPGFSRIARSDNGYVLQAESWQYTLAAGGPDSDVATGAVPA